MEVIPLTLDYELTDFDCGDSDLNEFLLVDAKHFLEKRIAPCPVGEAPCPAGRDLVDLVDGRTNTNRTNETNRRLALRAEIYKSCRLYASRKEPLTAAGGIIYEIYKISRAQGDAGESKRLALRAEIS